MMIVWADVEIMAPDLAATPVSVQDEILALVDETVPATSWGGEASARLRMARIYLAAHHATLWARATDAPGAIASESAGGMSVSYASDAAGFAGAPTASTKWGREYLELGRSLITAMIGTGL